MRKSGKKRKKERGARKRKKRGFGIAHAKKLWNWNYHQGEEGKGNEGERSDGGTVETLQKREAKFQEEEGSGRTMQKELGKTRT